MATNTYVALATTTLSSAASTITFSSINQGYTDLVLVFQATAASANMNYDIRIGNGTVDSGSNYSDTYLLGGSGGAQSNRASSQDRLRVGNSAYIQSSGGVFTATTHFMNYSNTTTYKTTLSRDGNVNQSVVESSVGLWRSTAAINIITLGDFGGATMAAGTTASLYGIAAQATPGTAKATGGTITYDQSGNVIHTFTSSGTFTPSQTLSCEYLVVAGGGGGGSRIAGGGGAGGYLTNLGSTPLSLSATGYTVTVGASGSGGVSGASGAVGGTGTNSTFAGLTSYGGGGGGAYQSVNATNGGSGGGSGSLDGNSQAGTGTAGQGNDGGKTVSNQEGAGGGGAGAVGASGSSGNGGNGGAGLANSISGTYVTYAGGGGGASSTTPGSGGTGGGGAGASGTANATNGTTNTGGGGGGARNSTDTSNVYGGNGGSGIVIIRYSGV